MIKTVNLTADVEISVELAGGVHARIENRGTGIVYASKADNVTAGEDGVIAVAGGSTKYLKNACSYANYEGNFGYKGTIFLKSSESGIVEIETGDYFFDSANKSEGGVSGKFMRIVDRVDTVDDLPITANEGDVYLVGLETDEDCEEYVYTTQKGWEHIGNTAVDLSGYISNESIDKNYGIAIGETGKLFIYRAENAHIDIEENKYRPIVPYNIPYIMSNYGIESKDDVSTLKSHVDENKVTLGYSGKNLLKGVGQSETIIEYKSISPLPIKAGKYILSGKAIRSEGASEAKCAIRFCITGSDYIQTEFICNNKENSKTVDLQKDYKYIRLYSGPSHVESTGLTTIYTDLMLRPASITDDTYEPYKMSVDKRLEALEAAILNS